MSCIPCGNLQMGKVIDLGAGVVVLDLKGSQYRAKLPPNCHPRIGQETAFYLCQGQAYAVCADQFKRMMPPVAEEEIALAFPSGNPIYPELPGTHKGNIIERGNAGLEEVMNATRSKVDPFYYTFGDGGIYAGAPSLEGNQRVVLPVSDLGIVPIYWPTRGDLPVVATGIARDDSIIGVTGTNLVDTYLKNPSTMNTQSMLELMAAVTINSFGIAIARRPEDSSEFFGTETRSPVIRETETTDDPLSGDEETDSVPGAIDNYESPSVYDLINIDAEPEIETGTERITTAEHDYSTVVINQELDVQSYENYRRSAEGAIGLDRQLIPNTFDGFSVTTTSEYVFTRQWFYRENYAAQITYREVVLGNGDTSRYSTDVKFQYKIALAEEERIFVQAYTYTVIWQRDEESGLGWLSFGIEKADRDIYYLAGPSSDDRRLRIQKARSINRSVTRTIERGDDPDTITYTENIRDNTEFYDTPIFGVLVDDEEFLDKELERRTVNKDLRIFGDTEGFAPSYLSALGGSGPIAREIGPEDYEESPYPEGVPPDIRSRSYLVADPELPDRLGVIKVVESSRRSYSDPDGSEITEGYVGEPQPGTIFGFPGTCSLYFDGWITEEDGSRRYVKMWRGDILPDGIQAPSETTSGGIFNPAYEEKAPVPKILYKGQFGTIITSKFDTKPARGQQPYKLLDIEIPISEPNQHGELLLRYRDVVYAVVLTIEGPEGEKQPYVRMQRKKTTPRPEDAQAESAWYPRVLDTWEGPLRKLTQDQFLQWDGQTLWNKLVFIQAPESVVKSDRWPYSSNQAFFFDHNYSTNPSNMATVVFRPTLPLDFPERHPNLPLVADDPRAIPPVIPMVILSGTAVRVQFYPEPHWTPEDPDYYEP